VLADPVREGLFGRDGPLVLIFAQTEKDTVSPVIGGINVKNIITGVVVFFVIELPQSAADFYQPAKMYDFYK